MTSEPGRGRARFGPAAEAGAAGLSYGAALCWVSVCLLASFRPDGLSAPYWSGLPGLRTDTAGIAAFAVLAVGATAAEYLRLRRRPAPPRPPVPAPGLALVTALARVAALLSAGLVLYLSVNAITHPATLALHATHLVGWPSEGTLRALALAVAVVSAAACRYLTARAAVQARPQAWPGPSVPGAVPAPTGQPGAPRSTR